MKKFLRVLALFLLPVALLYGLFAAVLVSTRELAGMEEIVAATLDGSLTLYGTSHHENFATYKLRVTSALAPRLLVLGTSRSMQLRGDFFSEKSFYNAGGAVRNMADYEDFLRRHSQGRILFLELGVGRNTPGIIKYPFWQLTLQRCYSYMLRPLHYFFVGYAAAWLLLTPLAQGNFFLRPKIRVWTGAVSVLILLGHLAFSVQFWFLYGRAFSRVWLEIYAHPVYLLLPGMAFCASLRPVPQKEGF